MKIKEIKINNFKRFTKLTVPDIPETAKLVVLIGSNGSGKTSFLEAFNLWHALNGFNSTIGDADYILKKGSIENNQFFYQNKVNITFYGDNVQRNKGLFYFRTAYRNEPDFKLENLKSQSNPVETFKARLLNQNDITVSENYQRLVGQTIRALYEQKNNSKTVAELRDELIGKIQVSLSRMFTDLSLTSIGSPLDASGSFYFTKGSSENFIYKNLSGGEKSAFDLILDIIIKNVHYPDAVFCIDEPEAHMHTKLQAKLLGELYTLISEKSQLWIATHSLGMLRKAEELNKSAPGSVVFLDFDDKDFDSPETIYPTPINDTIWKKFLYIALYEFADHIAPETIVFCEGTQKGRKYKNFDAQIYSKIFSSKYYGAKFISLGGCNELENINSNIKVVEELFSKCNVIKFMDKDDRSSTEIEELSKKGIKTSKKRNIEGYLLDDEIICKLCHQQGHDDLKDACLQLKEEAITSSETRGNPTDDIKSAAGDIVSGLKIILSLTGCGNSQCAFLRDTMASLITPETKIFQDLEKEIFE